jgi:hypothetical protein
MGFNYGRVGGAQIPAGGWVTGLDGYYGEMLIVANFEWVGTDSSLSRPTQFNQVQL